MRRVVSLAIVVAGHDQKRDAARLGLIDRRGSLTAKENLVADDENDLAAGQGAAGFLDVAGDRDPEPLVLNDDLHQPAHAAVVINNQNVPHRASLAPLAAPSGCNRGRERGYVRVSASKVSAWR
jgi:hypothetical protein